MRTRTFALAVLVAGLGLTGGRAKPPKLEYLQFASSAGKYKVLFPGPVKTEVQDVKTPAGVVKLTLDSVEVGGVTFVVTHLDFPATAAKVEPAVRLAKVRDGNKGSDGKLLSEKDVTVGPDKHPGRDVLIEKPDGVLRNRIVIAGNRLYQVMMQGPKGVVTGPDADRFFGSFEVTR